MNSISSCSNCHRNNRGVSSSNDDYSKSSNDNDSSGSTDNDGDKLNQNDRNNNGGALYVPPLFHILICCFIDFSSRLRFESETYLLDYTIS